MQPLPKRSARGRKFFFPSRVEKTLAEGQSTQHDLELGPHSQEAIPFRQYCIENVFGNDDNIFLFREDPAPQPRGSSDSEDLDPEEPVPAIPVSLPCSCGNCPQMKMEGENVCCRSELNWQKEFNTEGSYNAVQCIALQLHCTIRHYTSCKLHCTLPCTYRIYNKNNFCLILDFYFILDFLSPF